MRLQRTPQPVRFAQVIPGRFTQAGLDWARVWWLRGWLPILLLVIGTLCAYGPCLDGGFVWDDDAWTLKLQNLLGSLSGLGQIWSHLTALQQYYPLTASSFWLDYHLWGFWTLPYHVENVLLHILNALLFWKLLRRLDVPGAGLAAGIFAFHPLGAESVAWITERKNVLSLALFLGALLCYGRFTRFWKHDDRVPAKPGPLPREWRFYLGALVLFLASYLAKATTFAFPAVLLLICWWKTGTIRLREDVLPALPFFALTIGLGLLTSWLERHHVGANGPEWDLSWAQRCLIAGRALWFYAGKLVLPAHLCFIYPRWQLQSHSLLQWLYPISAAASLVALWALRARIGRGPLAAVLYFAGTLFPLLGFMNGYFMRYSFVCDHWTYLPCLGLIALGAALVTGGAQLLEARGLIYIIAALLLPGLAAQTWRQAATFADSETLYHATLAQNPNADLAHNNLGLLLFRAGAVDEAIAHFQRAVEIRPSSAHAHNNLANALRATGHEREAAEQYEMSLALEPASANTCINLAMLLATSAEASLRNGPRALELARRANTLTGGRNPVALGTLAAAFAETGRFAEAAATARRALQLASQPPGNSLAQALEAQIELYEAAKPLREESPDNFRHP
ncbi:MAG TPA: tetratricopeptide repeat protein [Verrucomicrobiae bacterium]|nr:tetratricopeptide repeat protein [Verrucomicrobiae bacterium]